MMLPNKMFKSGAFCPGHEVKYEIKPQANLEDIKLARKTGVADKLFKLMIYFQMEKTFEANVSYPKGKL